MNPEAPGSVTPSFEPPLVLRLEYDGDVSRDSFVFNIWLDLSCNLQRVDFGKLPYDIVVQVVTPAYLSPALGRRLRQMDRLRDAAWDTHMAYLTNWFSLSSHEKIGIPPVSETKCTNCCVKRQLCYHVEYEGTGEDRQPVREMLSLSLRRMTGKLDMVTATILRFRADLKGWRNFHEDRVVMGDHSPWHHTR